MKRQVRSTQRSARGQGIVAGVLVIIILAVGTAGACMLLCSSGMSNYYKEKMSFVASQAAKSVLSSGNAQNLNDQAMAVAQQLYTGMALTINDQTATASGNNKQMTVTVSGKVNVIPMSVTLSDTQTANAAATTSSSGPWVGCVSGVGYANCFIPCVNSPANPSGPVVGFTHAGLAP